MQGYLYLEQKRSDSQQVTFVSRYFLSFPFCGLKWFREEPTGETTHRLLVDNNVGGWVYGGNIMIKSYMIETKTVRPEALENYVYPFVIELQQGDDETGFLIRLATDDEDTRARWIEEVQKMMQTQNYLLACKECNAIPSSQIFFAHDRSRHSLLLEGVALSTHTLGSMVMAAKLNEPDGSLLQVLHLEHAQLADRHVPLVVTFMSFSPHLESLSLRDNYITCTGLVEIADAIPFCPHITSLNLSSNSIADKGALALSTSLSVLKRLSVFDVSRNRLTGAVTKGLALYLTRHDSAITFVSFAYNPIGDSIGTLVALLLTSQPSTIETVDVSYCSMGDGGVGELAAAIPFCSTIKTLRMAGNFAGSKVTCRLIAAVTQHYEKFGRFQVTGLRYNSSFPGGTGLNDRAVIRQHKRSAKLNFTVSIGGTNISKDLTAMAKQALRTGVTHLGDTGIAGNVILRRRASLFSHDVSGTQPIKTPSRLKQRLQAINSFSPSAASHLFVCSNGIGCIRVRLSHHINTVHDVLQEIARSVGAHPSQLVLISASTCPHGQICFILFAPLDPSPVMLRERQRLASVRRIGRRAYYERAQRQRGNGLSAPTVDSFLPTAVQIMQRFQDLCRVSDAKARKIGVMSIFMYIPTAKGSTPEGNGFTSVSFHVGGRSSAKSQADPQLSSMTGELFDFLPSLYPAIAFTERGEEGGSGDEVEDSDEDTGRRDRDVLRSSRLQRRTSSGFECDDDEDEGRGVMRKLDTFDDVFGVDAAVDADADVGASVEKAVLKNLDVRMVAAIAESYEDAGALDSDSAHFWEGVFGVPKWLKYTEAVIMAPVQEEGVFRAVAMRKRLCDAMFKRDVDLLGSLTEQMKCMNMPGGAALGLAENFLAELLTLKHSSESLPSLAQGPDDIHIVEKFLLTCARLGYAGPETFTAIDLREFLVRWALNENPAEFESDLKAVQRRATLTNMMISRNMKELTASVQQSAELDDQDTIATALEIKAAKRVIENEAMCTEKLRQATAARSLELIEDALAEAAYHNIYDEAALTDAIGIMLELGRDSRGIFIKINNAIRQGSSEVLDGAIMEVRRVGWTHSALSSQVLTRILAMRNRILQEEITKARVIKVAHGVSETSGVSNPAEVMQLLRRVRLLKLEDEPSLQEPLSMLQNKMRHLTGVQHQEEAIIKLLEEKNVAKLSELLSGRGQGKLVMAAPSADIMNDWYEALKVACKKKVVVPSAHRSTTNNRPFSASVVAATPHDELDDDKENLNAVIKAGSLEKAARGNEGVLRNWRLRYFVLQGDEMSYFTKLGGEKKGTIRVTGGAVRLLPAQEASGHHNCIELQEGRDLSAIDPELLDEVRKQVNIFRREQLEEELVNAIAVGSEDRLTAALESASSLGVSLDGELLAQARSVLMREQHKKLKLDLRQALVTLPRRRLQELIRTAKRVRLDPNNSYLRSGILHIDKSDVELTLLRARSSLGRVDDGVFKRAIASVQQLDAKRLSVREKYILVAILLQWTGYSVLRNLVQGTVGVSPCIHVLNQVLASTLMYYIETEPMQLARTVLEGLKSWQEGSEIDNTLNPSSQQHGRLQPALKDRHGLSAQEISAQDLSQQFQGANTAMTFRLDRFPQLKRGSEGHQPGQSSATSKSAKGGIFGFLGGSKKKLDDDLVNDSVEGQGPSTSLTFTTDSISAPMTNVARSLEARVPELFEGLQVVMLDRPLAQFCASQAKARTSFFSRADIPSICGDIVSAGVEHSGLRDELYLHVCKQISRNPRAVSRYYGWCVLSVYLNSFPPSFGLLPYLKNCVAEGVVSESKQTKIGTLPSRNAQVAPRRRFSVARGSNEDYETDIASGILKLTAYSTKLLNGIERTYARGLQTVVYLPNHRVLAEFLNGNVLEFEIVVMTGSVYRLALAPNDIDSPLSLLYALYKQLITGKEAPTSADYGTHFAEQSSAESKKPSALSVGAPGGSDSITSTTVTDVLLRTFRGFALYRAERDGGFADALEAQRKERNGGYDVFADVADDDAVPPIDNSDDEAPKPLANKNHNALNGSISWSTDLLDFAVQPSEQQLVDWGEDLLWELLVACAEDQSIPSRDDDSPIQQRRKSFLTSAISPRSSPGAAAVSGSVRKRFVLRKRTALCTEVFSDQFNEFEDALVDRDIVTSKKLWSSWLQGTMHNGAAGGVTESDSVDSNDERSDAGVTPQVTAAVLHPRRQSVHESKIASFSAAASSTDEALLPPDHVRVDLLFAEESRYVNAKKYIHSLASQAYLNALQLVLCCYSDSISGQPISGHHWGSGHHSVLSNASLSVRPCLHSKSTLAALRQSMIDGISSMPSEGQNGDEAITTSGKRVSLMGMTRRLSFGQSPLATDSFDSPHGSALKKASAPSIVDRDIASTRLVTALSAGDMTEMDKAALLQLCDELGIEIDRGTDELSQVIGWIVQFQSMAIAVGTPLLSPRFRYMVKRAYLGYLCAFPLYGSHFFDAQLLGAHMDSFGRNSQGHSTSISAVEFSVAETGLQSVCVAVNGEGVFLVAPDCWESIFVAPLFDITSMSVLPPVRSEQEVPQEDGEVDPRFVLPLFSMNVNGMEVQLLCSAATDVKRVVEAFCLEALSKGSFPHGTEGGNDIYEVGATFTPASDQKELMKRYLLDFPLLPNPPPPPLLPKSARYFSAPLSKRAILAEERAEEERREQELSRRAAESHVAKHMAKLETGRQVLSKIMAEDDEDEDELGDAAEHSGSGLRERSRAAREELERRRLQRVAAALSGVSDKPSNVTVDVIEPFSLRGGMLSPGDYAQYDRGKFHPPPLLQESIERQAGAAQSPVGVTSLGWPSDVKLKQPPKQFNKGGGGGDKWPSSVYLYARERDAASSEMKAALQLVDGNGMQYEYDEYLSRSMQAVAAHMEAFDDFDITEEGISSTSLSMSQPVSSSPAGRRTSQAAYSGIMRRGSMGIPSAHTVIDVDDGSVVPAQDDGDSVASDTSGGLRPSFDGNGVTPARKSSLLANRTRTLETFNEGSSEGGSVQCNDPER